MITTGYAANNWVYLQLKFALTVLIQLRGRMKAIDIGDAVISNKKIKDILWWKPEHELSNGLIKTRGYYESCLCKYLK